MQPGHAPSKRRRFTKVPLLLSAGQYFFGLKKERARSRVQLDDNLRPVRPDTANALNGSAVKEVHKEPQNDSGNPGADDLRILNGRCYKRNARVPMYGGRVLQRVAGDGWMRFDTCAFLWQANY